MYALLVLSWSPAFADDPASPPPVAPEAPAPAVPPADPPPPEAPPVALPAPPPDPVPAPDPDPAPAPPPWKQGAPRLVVLVHEDVPWTGQVSPGEVRQVYALNRQAWKGGARVVPVLLPDPAPATAALLKDVMKSTAVRYHAELQRKQLSGAGVPPRAVGSVAELVAAVAATGGAVGYAWSAELPDALPPLLRVVELAAGE